MDRGHRWAGGCCRDGPLPAGRDKAGTLLDGGWLGSVFVFLSTSSISTFSPITPTPGGTRASGILFSACSHGGALGEVLHFAIKKKENVPNTHISRNQWQLKKQMCLMRKLQNPRAQIISTGTQMRLMQQSHTFSCP